MDPPETLEALQIRHRKEQRDLQARITQKKKSASKKTRKGVNDECATLESELKERHSQELAALNSENGFAATDEAPVEGDPEEEAQKDPETTTNGIAESLQNTSISSPTLESADSPASNEPRKKPNRAKARLARRAAEQDALAAQAAAEAASMPDLREQERINMRGYFSKYELQEKEIRADGHCLYSAVADQMDQAGLGLEPRIQPTIADKQLDGVSDAEKKLPTYKLVRYAAADYIEQNPDQFAGFMEEPLEEYLRKIRETGEWGGHLELTALARQYGIQINVLQANGTVEEITPAEDSTATGDDKKVIWLGYYHHNFGLGEHYNSLRKAA
ncbi:OTU-like cysteine protease [Mytilinidion resinicola]|uniref:OTU-like cysteine protease n=1 Tax=Mytilinidion resinicola TaxID=574789 RepID=A0A6A6Z8W9_9PEZI|nr:OTU-like cysteine protease [Mytilinidion resinicola]KAF2816735.1 OTU-like cysteine protease [Mytilinidion resinicola]